MLETIRRMTAGTLAMLALAGLASGSARAQPHHGHGGHGGHGVSLGLHFGVPLGWYAPYYYPPPYYYYPPAVMAQPAPPAVYVERGDAPAEQTESWWYYCEQSRAYYPYVKDCPGGWQRVAPSPGR